MVRVLSDLTALTTPGSDQRKSLQEGQYFVSYWMTCLYVLILLTKWTQTPETDPAWNLIFLKEYAFCDPKFFVVKPANLHSFLPC